MSPTTSRYAVAEEGLFGEEELLPPLPPLRLPDNLLSMQSATARLGGTAALLDLTNEWRAERAGRPWTDADRHKPSYAWTPAICGPKYDADAEGCCPVILSVDLRCRDHWRVPCSCVGDLLYLHACTGCGHVDDARSSENLAAEDAMDHAWPEWRDLPVLATSMPDERRQQAAWTEVALEHYPAGWLERGGPVRTARSRAGSRHVPGRTPYNGYDMAEVVSEDHYISHVGRPRLYKPPASKGGTVAAKDKGLA